MNRQQLLNRLDTAWKEFQASYAGLASSRLTEPGVAGDWSVKDVIAHVTWWDEEALRHLPAIMAGDWPLRYSVAYGGIDAFNAMMAERKRDVPLPDILTQQHDTHQRLIDFIESVPEEHFTRDTRFRRRLRLDTYGHYAIHTKAIREWRQQRSF